MVTKTTHASHPEHELELKNYQKPYICDGCKQQGFGSRYRCELCDYDLHEDCAFNTPTMSHEFFKESNFKFFIQPPKENCSKAQCDGCKRYCDACGKTINGFVYHCEEKGWDLHPCCRNLKNKLCIDDVTFQLHDNVLWKCLWCNKKNIRGSVSGIRGWSYVSKCEKYNFHVYCTTEMVLEGWKNGANSDNCLALKNLELPALQVKSKRKGKLWRVLKIFLQTVACILLGDPTITLACLLLDLVS